MSYKGVEYNESAIQGELSRSCMVTINLSNSRSILIQERATDMYDAIQYCAQKMNRVLSRQLSAGNRFQKNSKRRNKSSAQTM
ncbi:MAG: hypothetical protein GKR93_16655 [Gammaproteobacteria bacterium]|nr:hypothetical protein [Gammaproteobacteria bacterium]